MGVLNSKSNNSLPTDEEVKRIKKLVGSQRLGQRLWNHYVKNHPEVKDHLPTDEEVKRIKKLVGSQRFGQRLWNHYVKNHPTVKDHYSSFHQHVFYMSDGEFLDAVSEDVGE